MSDYNLPDSEGEALEEDWDLEERDAYMKEHGDSDSDDAVVEVGPDE